MRGWAGFSCKATALRACASGVTGPTAATIIASSWRRIHATHAMTMQHLWRFASGKIVFFRGAEDTEQSAAAFA
jgi:hypothetical protein